MATTSDDAALRALFRETPLPGSFEVTLERESSYLRTASDVVQQDVFVGTKDEKIICCGSRTVRESWWQGQRERIGYLGDLRCHPEEQRRSGWLIRDGYRALAERHAQAPDAVTWTAVLEGNVTARELLTRHRDVIPSYLDRGKLYCPILLVPRWAKPRETCGVSLHVGQSRDWEEISTFLNHSLRHRHLAPVHRPADFESGTQWPGLAAADFILGRRHGRLIGVVAVWDLRPLKQVRVVSVRGWTGKMRRPINFLARLTGWPGLPENGSILPMGYLSFFATENENKDVARVLLLAARAAAARRGLSFLCACAHEDHPFAKVLQRLPAIASHGRLFQVPIGDCSADWPTSAPHIEPALL